MHHFFITPYTRLPANWQKAFPAMGAVQQAISLPRVLSGLLWLHYPQPDLLSLKHTMAALRHQYPDVGVIVLSNVPDDEEGLQALQAGALGYCHSLATSEMLAQVASVVTNGGLWVGESLLRRLMLSTIQATQSAPPVFVDTPDQSRPTLSPRERAVALAVAKGASNKEVARQLNITERTVKAHLSAVFEKMDVRDRLQLVLAMRQSKAANPVT